MGSSTPRLALGQEAPACRRNGQILLANLLQSSRSTLSRGSFLSFLAFKEGMLSTPISVLGGWPTVSGRLLHSMEDRTSYASWGPLYVSLVLFLLNYICYIYKITDHMFCPYE